MAAWPATLPQYPTLEGFQEQAMDITLRTPMDAGPPKIRPLYTAAPVDLTMTMVLTIEQRATLETFYEDTLGFGADAFDWLHPVTGAAVSMTFSARPGYTALGGGMLRVVMQTRIWP